MSTVKSVSKLMSVLMGLFGFGAIMSSCTSEKDCVCEDTYTYGGQTVTYSYDVSVEGDCESIDIEDSDLECREK